MLVKLLLVPLLFYLAVVGLVFFSQTALLFPTRLALHAPPPPPGSKRLALDTPEGHRLHGILIPPREPGPDPILILGFGGNAWNAATAAAYLSDLYPHAHVAAFHYRGYAPSAGRPSAAALLADAPLVHDLARARVGEVPVVAVGFSIGSGVAAQLASQRPLHGLILVTPFDSLAGLAASHYPWLPVRLLFRHRMEPALDLEGMDIPIALIAAGRDSIVPPARTDALRRAVRNLVYDRTLADADHNDLYQQPAFREAMREALERLAPAS